MLLVSPIHSDHDALTTWDVELPDPPIISVPKLKARSWVLLPSIQPLKKADIEESLGVLPMNVMLPVYQRLVGYSGLGELRRSLPS